MEPPGFKIDKEFVMKSLGFANNPDSTDSVVPQETGLDDVAYNQALAFTGKANLCTHAGIFNLALPVFNELVKLRKTLKWALEFVEEPDFFPGAGDRQWWKEKRDSCYSLLRQSGSEVSASQASTEEAVPKEKGSPAVFGREPTTDEVQEFKKKEFIDDY